MSIFEEVDNIKRPAASGLRAVMGGGGGGSSEGIIYNFTNCGSTSKIGPSASNIANTYIGTNLDGTVSWKSNGMQVWTVPYDGIYQFLVVGASGGIGKKYNTPGFGSIMQGELFLTAGTVLDITVGQKGDNSTGGSAYYGGGGGGLSMVVDSNNAAYPIIVAGGGGGSADSICSSRNANTLTFGLDGKLPNNGDGGAPRYKGGAGQYGAGGCGYTEQGGSTSYALGGHNYTGGHSGGTPYTGAGAGGFGGGGGGFAGAGGGGGYGGGGAGGYSPGGGAGGGGSYLNPALSNTQQTAGVNTGHGSVTITAFISSGSVGASLIIPVRKSVRL
ncbi:MAG: hypothetical protein DRQ46_10630 [Gammaproteobacteria bacterium]|nr:MAG: hypothetical protein DRQ46_10630 [Gammaproteobacteria bacterium]